MSTGGNGGGRLDGRLRQGHGAPELDNKDHPDCVSLDKLLFLTERALRDRQGVLATSKVTPPKISTEKTLESITLVKEVHCSSSLTFLWSLCSSLAKSHELLLTLLSWGFLSMKAVVTILVSNSR